MPLTVTVSGARLRARQPSLDGSRPSFGWQAIVRSWFSTELRLASHRPLDGLAIALRFEALCPPLASGSSAFAMVESGFASTRFARAEDPHSVSGR